MGSHSEPNSYKLVQTGGFRSPQQLGQHRVANTSGLQHPIRQPINARDDTNGFGVIGSGLRGETGRGPFNHNVGLDVHAPFQRAAYSSHPSGLTLLPGFVQAGTLAPHNGHQASGFSGATDQQLAANTGVMFRQLFNSTPVTNGNHGRAFTPTDEQLALSLQKIGMVSSSNNPNDILDIAQRSLEKSVLKEGSPDRKDNSVTVSVSRASILGSVVPSNEPSLSDSVSNGTDTSGEPRTPAAAPNNLADLRESGFRQPRRVSNGFGNDPIVGSSQIDPYIPEMRGSGFMPQGSGNCLPWYSPGFDGRPSNINIGRRNGKDVNHHNGHDDRGTFRSPQLFARFGNLTEVLGGPHSASSYDGDSSLHSQNEDLKREVQELKRQAHISQKKFDYACTIAIRNITIREAEIASLKRQIRQEGLVPYNDPATADDMYYEKELGMLFRMLCCWGKRFYKFPTGEQLPRSLHVRLGQICEDSQNEGFLMSSSQTKYLVVVSLAARWMMGEIFDPRFMDMVADSFKAESKNAAGGGLREVIEKAKIDSSYDDRLFETIQKASLKHAAVLIEAIKPLMSRPKDKSHHDQTYKQFVQVTQHAARIVFETTKRDATFFFRFPQLGEAFAASFMKQVTGDTLGLDVAAKVTTPIWHEMRGDMIRLCMLPHVAVSVKDRGGEYRQTDVYKANVLLF